MKCNPDSVQAETPLVFFAPSDTFGMRGEINHLREAGREETCVFVCERWKKGRRRRGVAEAHGEPGLPRDIERYSGICVRSLKNAPYCSRSEE